MGLDRASAGARIRLHIFENKSYHFRGFLFCAALGPQPGVTQQISGISRGDVLLKQPCLATPWEGATSSHKTGRHEAIVFR